MKNPMRAIFLDKDGTLVEDVPYNIDPARVRLSPGAGRALRIFQQHGYALFVASNQTGIARGFFREQDLLPVQARLRQLLAREGVRLTGFHYCPHHPDSAIAQYAIHCACRKPMPGLLCHIAHVHGIELQASWMIGDILDDVEAGRRAGCKTVLIDNGNETEWKRSAYRTPDLITPDLAGAARGIESVDRVAAAKARPAPGKCMRHE
jgi:D-glycero-D-manno-heptose 1,7-bisphosphate phosphatase